MGNIPTFSTEDAAVFTGCDEGAWANTMVNDGATTLMVHNTHGFDIVLHVRQQQLCSMGEVHGLIDYQRTIPNDALVQTKTFDKTIYNNAAKRIEFELRDAAGVLLPDAIGIVAMGVRIFG